MPDRMLLEDVFNIVTLKTWTTKSQVNCILADVVFFPSQKTENNNKRIYFNDALLLGAFCVCSCKQFNCGKMV